MSSKLLESKNASSDALVDIVFQGDKSAVIPSFSPLESLRVVVASDDSLFYVSDTYLLLNSERLRQTLGDDTYSAIMRTIGQSSLSKTPYVQGLSDSDMLSTLKSRYLQTPSEVRSYQIDILERGEGLAQGYRDYVARLDELRKSQQQQQQQQQQSKTE